MDCDDISQPQRFEKQIAYLDQHPESVAVGSRILLIDPDGMPICEFIDELTHDEIDGGHISGVGGCRICHPSSAMRREAVLRVGKYRDGYVEDLDLFLRLGEVGKLANLPDILLQYRQHLHSLGYAHWEEQWSGAKKAVTSARARRGMPSLPEYASMMEAQTSADAHRKWAWWALSAGNVPTALKHGFKAFLKDPFNLENLRFAACALRGH
jgi:hypothetical protein